MEDNKLDVDDLGNDELLDKYKKVTTSGEVTVYQNDENGKVIGFGIFKGMLSVFVQLVYSTS